MDALQSFFASADVSGWDLLFALIALIAGWLIARLARNGVVRIGARWPDVSPTIIAVLARVVKYFVWLIAIGVALAFLGANVQPLIVAAILVGVIALLALRGLASNFGASIIIQSRRPVQLGDEIEVGGTVGIVHELNARAVVVLTYDGRMVHIPNVDLLDDQFSNNSAHGARRSELEVRVGGPVAVDRLERILLDATAATPDVRVDPPARVLATELSPERATMRLQFWHAPPDGLVLRSSVVAAVSAALADAGLPGTVQSALPEPPLVRPPAH